MLQLSQAHLTLLEQCPRKFQYVYVDQLMTPIPSNQRIAMERGNYVHHLIHQRELLSPVGSWVSTIISNPQTQPPDSANSKISVHYSELYDVAAILSSAIPTVDETTVFRQSEYRLNFEMSGVLLTVIYDLLLLTDAQAHILDWKTYAHPPQKSALAHSWQTKLYPWVLAETSNYAPNQIRLSYWFVPTNFGKTGFGKTNLEQVNDGQEPSSNISSLKPECISFDYRDRLHQNIQASLEQTIQNVKHWLQAYPQTPFPQTEQADKHCTTCQFALRCDRIQQAQADWEALIDLSAIDEIPLE